MAGNAPVIAQLGQGDPPDRGRGAALEPETAAKSVQEMMFINKSPPDSR